MNKLNSWKTMIFAALLLAAVNAVAVSAQIQTGDSKKAVTDAQKAAPTGAASLKRFDELWQQAATTRDAEKMAALYTSDAVWLPPNDKRIEGRNLIREFYAKMFAEPTLSLVHTPSKHIVAASGDVAVEYGAYDFRMKTAKGEFRDTGKYMFYFAKENGEWKIAADIFNSDAPAAAPPPEK